MRRERQPAAPLLELVKGSEGGLEVHGWGVLPRGQSAATAGPPVVVYPAYPAVAPVCRHYRVMYRSCGREPWRSYSVYESSYRAEHAAHHLRHRGFEVIVSVG